MRAYQPWQRAIQRLTFVAVVLALLLTQVLTPQPVSAAPVAAPDALLSMVDVAAPDINCLFDTDCTITVSDLADYFTPPAAAGDAFLQSRTWPIGEAGTVGAGLYAYLYRIDLSKAVGVTAASCVTSMAIDFGPVTPLDYNGDQTADQLFVVVKGGLGSIRPAAAEQTGDTIVFHFDPAVCVGARRGGGDSSFFFGLASTQPPQDVTAHLEGTLGLNETLDARAPQLVDHPLSGTIAYVLKNDTGTAAAFKALLEGKGFSVTLVPLGNVLATDFSQFDLTLVADDTGYLDTWGDAAGQVAQIADHSPVLGIGEGGYSFFGELGLQIGWPNGWHGTEDEVVGNPALSYYQTPTDLTGLLGAPLPLFSSAVGEVGIYLPEPVAGVTVLGTEPDSDTHHPLVAQGCNQLWGFRGRPEAMTDEGKELFVNAVVYAMSQCRPQRQSCNELESPTQIPAPALVNFDDLADAVTIADSYVPSYGLHFYTGDDTNVITYADRDSDPTKARSTPNVATNNAVSSTTSAGIPLTFWFDEPKTHVGFYMGNGENQKLFGTMVAYDATGKVICVVRDPVPEPYQEFLGIYDAEGRIAIVTLDYGDSLLSESIDDLYFAPHDPKTEFPTPEEPPFEVTNPLSITIGTSTNQTFTANFQLPEAQLISIKGPDGISYTQFILPGVDIYGNTPGLPDVPMTRRLLAVPRGAIVKLVGMRVVPGDEYTVDLWPAQESSVDTPLQQEDGELPPETFQDPPFTKDADAYASDQLFPAEIVSIQAMGQMRDLDLVQLNIAGGQYNPKTKLLKLFKSVEFEVIFEGGEDGFLPEAQLKNPFEQSFQGIYEQVLNRRAIYEYLIPEIIISPPSCWGHEFIIITHPDFRPAADALRNWKVSRGLSTVVIETGNDPGDAGTTNTQIRNTIRSRYNNCLVRPSYVLLLGDAEFIPPFYRTTMYGDSAGTDLDYSLMTNADIMPDLAYGRIPVDTLTDAQRVIDKIINYENLPPFNASFYSNVTVASYFQCCRPDVAQDGTTSRSFIETAELIRNGLLARGYTVERIYNTDTAYHNNPAESSYYNSATRSTVPNRYYNGALLPADLRASSGYAWDGDGTDVINAFNAGRFLMLHRDHGGPNGWGDPSFGTGSLASLSNGNRTPVVYSINCASGLFDNETLNPAAQGWNYNTSVAGSYWAERLLRMEGGAVGIIGDTRNSPTWANSALARGLFDATWPTVLPTYGGNVSYRRLGDILNYGKAYMVSQVGVAQTAGSISNDAATTNVILYHVFGDPSMKMWTSYPYVITFPWWASEVLTISPRQWEIHYPVNGATLTALQDGNPVARGEVIDGKVVLDFIGDVDESKPIELSAINPDGTGAQLGVADANGVVLPQGGGVIEHPASQFKIAFGDGSVAVQTEVFYNQIDGPSQPLDQGVQGLRHFTLDAFDEAESDGNPAPVTQFNQPYSLILGYSDEELATKGLDEASLRCETLDANGQWQPVTSQVDAANNTVTCTADHFTEFALVGGEAPQAPQNQLFLPLVTK
jgi:hypothetical protein